MHAPCSHPGILHPAYFRYKLPAAEGLSPLIRGLPGKAAGEDPDATRHKGVKLFKPLANDTAWTLLCKVAPGLLVNKVGGEEAQGLQGSMKALGRPAPGLDKLSASVPLT